MLLAGLWEAVTPRSARSRHSASSSQQQCAATVRGEAAAFVEEVCGAFAEPGDAVDDLLLGLGEVDVDADLLLFCEGGAPGEPFGETV